NHRRSVRVRLARRTAAALQRSCAVAAAAALRCAWFVPGRALVGGGSPDVAAPQQRSGIRTIHRLGADRGGRRPIRLLRDRTSWPDESGWDVRAAPAPAALFSRGAWLFSRVLLVGDWALFFRGPPPSEFCDGCITRPP